MLQPDQVKDAGDNRRRWNRLKGTAQRLICKKKSSMQKNTPAVRAKACIPGYRRAASGSGDLGGADCLLVAAFTSTPFAHAIYTSTQLSRLIEGASACKTTTTSLPARVAGRRQDASSLRPLPSVLHYGRARGGAQRALGNTFLRAGMLLP